MKQLDSKLSSIVGFGDSITYGIHLRSEDTYLYKLGAEFQCDTYNAAVPGQTTADALLRLEEKVCIKKPELCILQFGMNDHVLKAPNMHKVSGSSFYANLIEMIEKLKEHSIMSLLCTVHPIIEGNADAYYYKRHPQQWYESKGANELIVEYNPLIRDAAGRYNCLLADIEAYWTTKLASAYRIDQLIRTLENAGEDDGVHPTPLAQQLYYECIRETILSEFGAEGYVPANEK